MLANQPLASTYSCVCTWTTHMCTHILTGAMHPSRHQKPQRPWVIGTYGTITVAHGRLAASICFRSGSTLTKGSSSLRACYLFPSSTASIWDHTCPTPPCLVPAIPSAHRISSIDSFIAWIMGGTHLPRHSGPRAI